MASPTTTIFAPAIFWRRASNRSRVMERLIGMRDARSGMRQKRAPTHPASRIAHPVFVSRYPSLFLGPPRHLHSAHPPGLVGAENVTCVRDQVNSAISRQHPPSMRDVTRHRQLQCALDYAGE